jgi:hypothetical protein
MKTCGYDISMGSETGNWDSLFDIDEEGEKTFQKTSEYTPTHTAK